MMARVLVAEDNEKNRILLRQVLAFCGLEMIEATDGAECLNLVKEQRPDLILMDLQMPVMDGYTAITALKNDPRTKDIPIISVTSFAMMGDREKAFEAGTDDYIAKPIDIKELIEQMKKYVRIVEQN